jgi:predicted DNA-binding transcriptional regulator
MALRSEILKPGGYASVPSCVLSSRLLGPSDKLVYVSILSHLGKNKASWPIIETIMGETALSRRTVLYSIKRLKEIGLIKVKSGFTGIANTYTFENPDRVLEGVRDGENINPRLGVMGSATLAP